MRILAFISVLVSIPLPAISQYSGLNSGPISNATTTGFCQTAGCTFNGLVTIASQGITSPSGINLTVTSGGATNPTLFKVGPNGGGAIMLELGGSANNIAPQTEHFPMSEINKAFARLESGKARYRIVLDADF